MDAAFCRCRMQVTNFRNFVSDFSKALETSGYRKLNRRIVSTILNSTVNIALYQLNLDGEGKENLDFLLNLIKGELEALEMAQKSGDSSDDPTNIIIPNFAKQQEKYRDELQQSGENKTSSAQEATSCETGITATLNISEKTDLGMSLQTVKVIIISINNSDKLSSKLIIDNAGQRTYVTEKLEGVLILK
uniref:Uncharacterized protein n=1 Tax=Glossina palpalis gambiensis TaxID=67801 RepID=A0A1B0B3P8_9MUSC